MGNNTVDRAQLDKFKQAARDLECDEDDEAFKRSFRAVVKEPIAKNDGKGK